MPAAHIFDFCATCSCGPVLGVEDALGREIFTIVGPCLWCDWPCFDVTFEIRSAGEAVGELRRHGETLTPAQDPVGREHIFVDDEPLFGLTMPQCA